MGLVVLYNLLICCALIVPEVPAMVKSDIQHCDATGRLQYAKQSINPTNRALVSSKEPRIVLVDGSTTQWELISTDES